ncbi:MAG: hypothetical protein B0W54_11775 [Cellvibrio sp. 79]|nr:MAG: hypothetical protein B0W54_11775 [Cellvibrio sp. 79]
MSEFTLQAITAGDSLQLSEVIASIAAHENQSADRVRAQLADEIIQPLNQNELWDEHLHAVLQTLWPVLSNAIASDNEFFCNHQHPLRQLLQTLLAGRYWYPREGKAAQQFLDKFLTLIIATQASLATANTAPLQHDIQQFADFLASEDKRAAMLESRLCETELANLKQISAETRVIDLLNKNLAHRPFPTDLHGLISGTLKSELQYWAFNKTPDELTQLPLWKSWNRLLPALGELFSADDIEVDQQYLYQQIPLVIAELERSSEHPVNNNQAYQQFLDHLNAHLMAAIQKQALENSLFMPLTYSASQSTGNTQVPYSLLKQTEQLHVGDWFIFFGENNEVLRCKLALKNPQVDQLLLVDHTGRKVMIKSHKDFALCLSTGIAKPLPAPDIHAIIHTTLPVWIERANIGVQAQLLLQKQKAEQVVKALIAQQQAAAEAAAKARAEAEARMQKQLEARRAAARKAMAEARVLADEQRRREAEQAAEAERLRIEQAAAEAAEQLVRQQSAQQAVSELQVGAWLEINSNNEKQRAKLSVIIASTSKYIFADQVGRKVAEYTREQLQELVAQEQIKIVRNGDNFEDQLAKVIRGLRRDLN